MNIVSSLKGNISLGSSIGGYTKPVIVLKGTAIDAFIHVHDFYQISEKSNQWFSCVTILVTLQSGIILFTQNLIWALDSHFVFTIILFKFKRAVYLMSGNMSYANGEAECDILGEHRT